MDVVTLNAAKQYAEQLGLGGAVLQEAVETKVNEYLAEKNIASKDDIYGYDRSTEIYNGKKEVSGSATAVYFSAVLYANTKYAITLTCDEGVISSDNKYPVGITYEESGYKNSQFDLPLNKIYEFTPTENVKSISIWLANNSAGFVYLSVTKIDVKTSLSDEILKSSLKQMGTFSIIGDSYSSFSGWIPDDNGAWYPRSTNEITNVKQTWWHLLSKKTGMSLIKNESYAGSTVCTTGYDSADSTVTSFVTRVKSLGLENMHSVKPNIIFVFGGLNDYWASAPVGSVQYDTFEVDDLKSFLPAYSYLIDYLQTYNPNSRIISIVPSSFADSMKNGIEKIADHYGTEIINVSGFETEDGHPNISGMETICNQIISGL